MTYDARLNQLEQIKKDRKLSLREAGELDAIRHYGTDGWLKHQKKWMNHKKPRNGKRTNVGDPLKKH